MRILIAGTTYYPAINGQASFTINLAEGLARKGHQVQVVTQSVRGSPYRFERNGVQVHAIRSFSLSLWYPGAYFSPFPGRTVRRVFRTFKPEILHIQDHYPLSRCAYQMARRKGLKVVGTNHFMPENLAPYFQSMAWFKAGFNWVLWRWMLDLYNRLDIATAPSKTAASILHRQGLSIPVFPISCGVDLGRFFPDQTVDRRWVRLRFGLDPERTTFLFVGRVDGEKRVDVLVKAMQYLAQEDIQLAVAGKGAALHHMQKLAQDLGVSERVRFTGYIPDADLPALLNSVDVFAMPSEAELLSIATLEAMACGRPVLAARAQALPELVNPGVNGYLFRPGDSLEAARMMRRIADQKASWPEMQAASLAKVQPHGLDYTLDRYEEVYSAALGKPPSGSRVGSGSNEDRLNGKRVAPSWR